jgi:hypothetical protein
MAMARVWIWMLIVATAGCGGATVEVGSRDGGGAGSGAGGGSASGSAGGPTTSAGTGWTAEAGPPAAIVCDKAGQRRDATSAEMGQYCVCQTLTQLTETKNYSWLVWTCYGPPPGSPTPSTICKYADINPGMGGSCWVNWSSCSDGKVYSFSCANRFCQCFIEGRSTAVRVEPRDTCPQAMSDLDVVCGWNLQMQI